MPRITITRPDDWHIHLRDGDVLDRTVNDVALWAHRAVVMPNLTPPVKTAAEATQYHARIMAALADNKRFEPLMTLYLTDATTPQDIKEASDSELICGVKLYPAGATTNSAAGVTGLETLKPTLAAMQECDLPLLIHGEVTDPDVDIFDREAKFIERTLGLLVEDFPKLRIILEHITTQDSVDFVSESRAGVAATITPQHLLFDRNDMLVGGIRPEAGLADFPKPLPRIERAVGGKQPVLRVALALALTAANLDHVKVILLALEIRGTKRGLGALDHVEQPPVVAVDVQVRVMPARGRLAKRELHVAVELVAHERAARIIA